MRLRSSEPSTRSRLARAASLLACGIALAAIGSACGSDEPAPSPEPSPTAAEPAPGGAVPPAAAIPAPAGEAATGEPAVPGVLPADFPTDIPIYPGSATGSAEIMPGLGLFATFESDDDAGKIVDHYRDELTKGGWNVTDAPDGTGIDAAKDNRSLAVRVRKNEQGRSEIAIADTES